MRDQEDQEFRIEEAIFQKSEQLWQHTPHTPAGSFNLMPNIGPTKTLKVSGQGWY